MAKLKNFKNTCAIEGTEYGSGATDANRIVAQVAYSESYDEQDGVVQGDAHAKPEPGLENGEVTLTIKANEDLASVYAINALKGQEVTIVTKPDGDSATSASNQEATLTARVMEQIPFGGAPGEIPEQTVTWPLTASISYSPT